MHKRFFCILTVSLVMFAFTGCKKTQPSAVRLETTTPTVAADQRVMLGWSKSQDAVSYEVVFYNRAVDEKKMARSIKLDKNEWQGYLTQGEYSIVVYAKNDKRQASNPSNTVSVVSSDASGLNWDDVKSFLSDTIGQIQSKINAEPYEQIQKESVVYTFDNPVLDVYYNKEDDSEPEKLLIKDKSFYINQTKYDEATFKAFKNSLKKTDVSYTELTNQLDTTNTVAVNFYYQELYAKVYFRSNKIVQIEVYKKKPTEDPDPNALPLPKETKEEEKEEKK
jgi:hypothetical protein